MDLIKDAVFFTTYVLYNVGLIRVRTGQYSGPYGSYCS